MKEFIEKGYPIKKLKQTKEKVNNLDRNELLKPKNQKDDKDEKTIFLTATYRERYQFVPKIIKSNWDILAQSCTTKVVYRSKLNLGYKKPKDLRNYLIRAKTEYNPTNDTQGEGNCAEQ